MGTDDVGVNRTKILTIATGDKIDLAIGQRGYGKAHAHWGQSWERFGIVVEGVRLGSDGFKELDGGGETGFAKNEGMLKLRANGDPAARAGNRWESWGPRSGPLL